jgi:hypothetical protein
MFQRYLQPFWITPADKHPHIETRTRRLAAVDFRGEGNDPVLTGWQSSLGCEG